MWVLPAVLTETSGYLGTPPLNKEFLRSASIISGAEYVIMLGIHLMLKLPADNWDYSIQVRSIILGCTPMGRAKPITWSSHMPAP